MDMLSSNWMRQVGVAALGLMLAVGIFPDVGLACSQCFGTSVNNATTFGISMSMLGLLGFLGIVFGGIGLFVRRVQRRSKMLELEDWVVTEDGEIEALDD